MDSININLVYILYKYIPIQRRLFLASTDWRFYCISTYFECKTPWWYFLCNKTLQKLGNHIYKPNLLKWAHNNYICQENPYINISTECYRCKNPCKYCVDETCNTCEENMCSDCMYDPITCSICSSDFHCCIICYNDSIYECDECGDESCFDCIKECENCLNTYCLSCYENHTD